MDLEQLRKINTLSSELKRHGMAETSQDAYTQAQQIITITPKSNPAAQETIVVEQQPRADPLAQRQATIEAERIQKTINDELELLRTTINQIITEVNALREDLTKVQSSTVIAPKPKEKQAELQTPKESHPRQGDFKPGDIDIKSVFYFGNGGPKK